MPAHIHAANMALYAQDAAETDRPWERWQCRHADGRWYGFDRSLTWLEDVEYRRKPRTIRIGEFDVPEPLRVAPAVGVVVHMVSVYTPTLQSVEFTWAGVFTDLSDSRLDHALRQGFLHLTREAAELHAKALLSFTEVK